MREHGAEPVRGLPERLPAGERLLWQGVPDAKALARQAFHVRTLAFYFAALLAWNAAASLSGGAAAAARSTLLPALLAAGALGLLMLLARLTARTTVYTITSRRVVIRFGIALPVTVNLPFAAIESAGLREHASGTGDIPLLLAIPKGLPWPVLWPHVRPWRITRPQPMLRAVPDAARAAQILARALAASASQPAPASPQPALPPGTEAATPETVTA